MGLYRYCATMAGLYGDSREDMDRLQFPHDPVIFGCDSLFLLSVSGCDSLYV